MQLECKFSDEIHGNSGELPLEIPTYLLPLADAFVAAGLEQGYPYADLNGRFEQGKQHKYSHAVFLPFIYG